MLSESEGANVDLVLFKVNDDIAVDILNSLKFFEAILISFLLHNWSTVVHFNTAVYLHKINKHIYENKES